MPSRSRRTTSKSGGSRTSKKTATSSRPKNSSPTAVHWSGNQADLAGNLPQEKSQNTSTDKYKRLLWAATARLANLKARPKSPHRLLQRQQHNDITRTERRIRELNEYLATVNADKVNS